MTPPRPDPPKPCQVHYSLYTLNPPPHTQPCQVRDALKTRVRQLEEEVEALASHAQSLEGLRDEVDGLRMHAQSLEGTQELNHQLREQLAQLEGEHKVGWLGAGYRGGGGTR